MKTKLTCILLTLLLLAAAVPAAAANGVLAIADYTSYGQNDDRAMRYDLTTADAAEDYFARLLDSQYIGLCGDVGEAPTLTDGKWRLRETNADGTELTAVFDEEGVISSIYIGTDLAGELQNSPEPYVMGEGDDSVIEFIRKFVYAYLPDVTIDSGSIVADQYSDEGRFLTCRTGNRFADPAYEFIVQIEPVPRIVSFRLLADEDKALIRTSPKAAGDADADAAAFVPTQDEAVAIARSAIADTFDIPQADVDAFVLVEASYHCDTDADWYDLQVGPYWVVFFRLPDTSDAFYGDYSVIINAETGEVVSIHDPSNISNG